jgi:methionyl-tRNA formyltransferase
VKRVLFIGTTSLSFQLIEALLESSDLRVVGVITGQEKFDISYSADPVRNYNFADLSKTKRGLKVPIFIMNKGMKDPELDHWVQALNFDFILVVGWYHMIPNSWIRDYICLGVHASLLPKYRGGAPLVWAIINGESETGVSLFLMDAGVDTGPVIGQSKFKIEEEEYISSLMGKVVQATIELCLSTLPNINLSEQIIGIESQELPTYFPQRKPEDGRINQKVQVNELARLIRAQAHPYPGAYAEKDGKKLYFWSYSFPAQAGVIADIGTVIFRGQKLGFQCEDGILEITSFSLTDGKSEINSLKQISSRWGV